MSSESFKNVINKMYLQIIKIEYICMILSLNKQQRLIYHKNLPNETNINICIYSYIY